MVQHNNDLVRFSRELPAIADVAKLKYEHRWYIGSKAECSCTFRHLHSVELGFQEPEEWYQEDADGIDATVQLIEIIRRLVMSGQEVDCVDAWEHQEMNPAAELELDVDLSTVSNAAFRFFENHHFVFRHDVVGIEGGSLDSSHRHLRQR